MHWIAILGYRTGANGEEIMVTDSGHGNNGWFPIDEFDGIVSSSNSVVYVNEA